MENKDFKLDLGSADIEFFSYNSGSHYFMSVEHSEFYKKIAISEKFFKAAQEEFKDSNIYEEN